MEDIKNSLSKAKEWAAQDSHKRRMGEVKEKLGKVFTDHPRSAGETYFVHLRFTLKMALWFFYIGFAIFVHGIFPFMFVTTASSQMEKVSYIMKGRKPKSDNTSGDSI